MVRREVVIVGSGPAGSSTALHLLKTQPSFAGEVLILEKAVHPREKVCAGGLIPHTLDCLRELDIPLSVPHVVVDRALVRLPRGREVHCEGEGFCYVVRRSEFDAFLVQTAKQRGAEVHEGEKVLDLTRDPEGICLRTNKEEYRARVIVGADGAGSVVRRKLLGNGTDAIGKAIMCDIPLQETSWSGFLAQRYDFNFVPVAQGLKGYLWAFPCLIDGVPHVNVGVYSLGVDGLTSADLRRLLHNEILSSAGHTSAGHASRFKAFPIHGYAGQAPLAAPHVLLVGDAAGVDPLMGEGISLALEYGKIAAAAIIRATQEGDFSFATYTEGVRYSWMGKRLHRLVLATRLFYGRTHRFWFALAGLSPRVQEIGLKWYNGVDGWHQRSGWEAIKEVLQNVGGGWKR
jgi:geranylgeranyl reductase family protein